MLTAYAAGHAHDLGRTLYPTIARLRPAHRLRATADGIDIARYFSWSSATRPARHEPRERFAELLDRAVRRMVSVVPIASLLSGGLDSSSVVAMAQRQAQRLGRGPLTTYSQVYPHDAAGDELGRSLRRWSSRAGSVSR